MSIGSIAGKASALYNAASQIFGLGGKVRLGSFTFAGIEVPETIKWGGKQKIVSHVLPGGTVILNSMGIEYPPLSFGGIFEGFTALTRSRQLYTMMNAAQLIPMSWNDRLYTVMIEDYSADDTQPNWIPYRITLRVQRDETLFAGPAPASLLSQVTSDIASAIGITPSDLAGVSSALSTAQTAAQAVGAVTGGSSAAIALTGALNGAQVATGAALAAANGNMGALIVGAAGAASVFPTGGAAVGAANMTAALAASSDLAAASTIKGQIGRAQTNVGNAST